MESSLNKNTIRFNGFFFAFNVVMLVCHFCFISLIAYQIIDYTPEPQSMSSDLFGKVLFARVTFAGQVLLSMIIWMSIFIINKLLHLKRQPKRELPKTVFWFSLSPMVSLGILLLCEICYPLQFHMEL